MFAEHLQIQELSIHIWASTVGWGMMEWRNREPRRAEGGGRMVGRRMGSEIKKHISKDTAGKQTSSWNTGFL
jgi:hypothetical protein